MELIFHFELSYGGMLVALKRIGKALSDVERLEQKTKKPLKDQGLFLMSGGQGVPLYRVR
ncbi:hypothetical protein SDC9_156948 [bioreactor metagenome]|uniref:Uncharacterized protein n=1 Tax=bioreactor metagenome TaxID=1076179 RepID=A0A645F637_9ZZZZ